MPDQSRFTQLLAKEEELRREEYRRYLRSPQWKARCAAVLKRDKGCCRFCGGRATQVHHLTYARIFNESLYDLVAICENCHRALHPDKGRP